MPPIHESPQDPKPYEVQQQDWLTPEHAANMAKHNPGLLLDTMVLHMAATTELGAAAWNHGIETGLINPDAITFDTTSPWSEISPGHRLQFGIAELPSDIKEHVFYGGEHMSYADTVARILLHEVAHGPESRTRRDSYLQALTGYAKNFRTESNGRTGLSALGSTGEYAEDGPEEQAREDTTELVTMQLWGQGHLDEFLGLLSSTDPRDTAARKRVGLAYVDKEHLPVLRDLIKEATTEGLEDHGSDIRNR